MAAAVPVISASASAALLAVPAHLRYAHRSRMRHASAHPAIHTPAGSRMWHRYRGGQGTRRNATLLETLSNRARRLIGDTNRRAPPIAPLPMSPFRGRVVQV